jgi:uncharacterized protein YbjQ (UPF0145 family)
MSEWDGRGLPPAAAARMARAAGSPVAGSLLSVPGAVTLAGCGFDPVGEAMGCIVQHVGWQGYANCGYYGFGPLSGPTVTSGGRGTSRWAGFGPYVDALYHGWDTAVARLLTEAQALGADGVVDVRLTQEHLGASNREFVALGTAVRSRGREHARRPFATHVSGQDVAKLLHAGWVPTGILFGISVAIRHDDYRTMQQASWSGANVEVTGYTELVGHVREDARTQFQRHAARLGGDAAVVDEMSLHVHEIEPSEAHRDHVAEAVVRGTAIARFHRGAAAPTSSLTILPLRRTEERHR